MISHMLLEIPILAQDDHRLYSVGINLHRFLVETNMLECYVITLR